MMQDDTVSGGVDGQTTNDGDKSGSSVVWWILGPGALAGLAMFCFVHINKNKKSDREGGDLYTRLIDEEIT